MSDEIYKVIEIMNDRITDLQLSYRVLNDNHRTLEVGFTEMRAQFDTIGAIVKFFISPSLAFLILVQLARFAGVST